MSKVIGIVQVKGGAGRSTIATNLAASLSAHGTTLLIDSDMPQGTAASWYALRQQSDKANGLALTTTTDYRDLVEKVGKASEMFDFTVIDAPPRIAEVTRAIVAVSHLLLVPLSPSAPEIWATNDLLATLVEAQKIRKDIDARIIWNRYRGYTRGAQEMSEAADEELDIEALTTRLGFRVAYADAMARGLSVEEWHDRTAKTEWQQAADEVAQILGVTA